ncbi:MAG: hypothetical protein RMA76_34935 [Deltaproteobacteria bacterium]|jgi:hypothetical protein
MTLKTQLTMTAAMAGAALSFACGRAEINTGADPDPVLSYNILDPQLDVSEIQGHPALTQVRLTNVQTLRHSLPPVNLNPVSSSAQRSGPVLTEWNHSALQVSQIEFMPMLYEEVRGDEVHVLQVHFDEGRLVRWARWNDRDGTWVRESGEDYVALERRERPISLWSDLLGIVELHDCRADVDGRFACDARREARIDTYFPRAVGEDEGPASLACLEGCLNPQGIGTDPYFHNIDSAESQQVDEVVVSYQYDSAARMLYFDGERVLPAEGEPHAVSGFMFENTEKNLHAMACNYDGKRFEGVCTYQVLDRYYTWSTDSSVSANRRLPRVQP